MAKREATECPTCGWTWRAPLLSYLCVSWTDDCACSDRTMCVAHQADPLAAPNRPDPAIMTARATAQHERALERYHAKASALTEAALRLLAANLATAAGLAEAFELGNLHVCDVYWHGGKHAWRPGCGRPAQGWGK